MEELTVEQRLEALERIVAEMTPVVLELIGAATQQGDVNVQIAQGMVRMSVVLNALSQQVSGNVNLVPGEQLPPPAPGAAVRAPHPDGSGYL